MREFYYPQSARLKKHIKYISFHTPPDNEPREFLVFPNPGTAIALYRDLVFQPFGKNTHRSLKAPGNFSQLLHINRIDPVKVIDTARTPNITIVFYPPGVNHYIPGHLCDLVKKNDGDPSYIPLEKFFPFDGFSKKVFSLKTRREQLSFMEEYLLQKYCGMEMPLLNDAISLLSDLEQPHTIPGICSRLGTSPRNLTRLFNKHICLSPVELKSIYQFRFSLEKKFETGGKLRYKDIGYESNYSHSSYMIRMYRKYTGLNPSSFFDKVSVEGNYVSLSL